MVRWSDGASTRRSFGGHVVTWAVALGASVLAAAGCSSCSGAPTPIAETPVAIRAMTPAGPADLRVIAITDLEGYLEPCGCTSRPLGGIDRLAARVRALSSEGTPTLFVAAGDLFFHPAEAAEGGVDTSTQERMKADVVADVLGRIGLRVGTLGTIDLSQGAATTAALATQATFPLLVGATVPVEGGERALDATTLVELDGHLIGVVGLVDRSELDPAAPAIADVGRDAARTLRERGAELVIALLRAPRRAARTIATIEGIDLIVQGGLDEASAHAPSVVENAAVLHAGRQGQGLVVADLRYRHAAGPFVDVSVWSREAERTNLDARVLELTGQLTAWEQEGRSAEELEPQRARLRELEAERAALVDPPAAPGRSIDVRYLELDPSSERDAAITELMGAFDRRLNDHNREAFADVLPTPATEGQPSYVGSDACASCHATEHRWWRTTPHGRAYATLTERHKEFNLSCVGCHVTGYQRPGGSNVTHVGPLADVGCENCHGPASLHIENPSAALVNVHRDAPEEICARCHTPEHSDRFLYPAYRAINIVPGHGLPDAPAAP